MKRILKIAAIVVGILILAVIALPFLINVNSFRPKIESEVTSALGRETKIGNLSLSILSGGVTADQISIADDPAFSKAPFLQAKSLTVGVELMPLIFSKTLNVTEITLDQPEINVVKSANGEKWNFSSLGNSSSANSSGRNSGGGSPAQPAAAQPQKTEPARAAEPAAGNPNVSVAKLTVKDGRITISRVAAKDPPRVYDKVNIEVTNFAFASAFPFKVSASLPGGGSLDLDGKAGPIDATDAAATPLDAKVTVKQFSLAESGFVDPASGIAGVADLDETLSSDGREAKTNGTLKATNLKVAQKGSPAGKPVDLTYAVVYDLAKQTGSINQCDIAMGKAVAHLTGTYDTRGSVTAVDMKLVGQSMPVDDLEAMLPALGVVLPPKAELKGGDINTNLAIIGPVDKVVITGSVRMENTALANFDLGSKLSSISALSGKKTGNDTTIQNFSSDVRVAPEGTKADNINLNVPSIGVLTGNGTVSPANELAFKMNASLGGLGVPFSVEGTTSDPKFVPDVKGMATGLLKGVLGGKNGNQNPLGGLSGLFKKKQ